MRSRRLLLTSRRAQARRLVSGGRTGDSVLWLATGIEQCDASCSVPFCWMPGHGRRSELLRVHCARCSGGTKTCMSYSLSMISDPSFCKKAWRRSARFPVFAGDPGPGSSGLLRGQPWCNFFLNCAWGGPGKLKDWQSRSRGQRASSVEALCELRSARGGETGARWVHSDWCSPRGWAPRLE